MCKGPQWKREKVPDHKFDFVDVREFTDHGFAMRMKYLWLYAIVLKSFLVYVSDIFSAITMLSTTKWSNQIFDNCKNIKGCVPIDFNVGKWLFVGCIIFSFLLLAYESRKAKKIVASRDISYAFTNIIAHDYYSVRSYDHFCFFDHISNSTKKKDDFAFFIFFTFKTWKRVILADGPRQTINALTLWSIYLAKQKQGNWYDVSKYFRGNALSVSALTVSTFFTVVVFFGSLLLLIIAGIGYIPLLCYMRGNLKEYVCHKVDKRISQIIKRRNKERLNKLAENAKKEAMGDYSHLKNKKGELIAQPLPQPTLPNLTIDDDFDDSSSMGTRKPPPSAYTQDSYYYPDPKNMDYPPPMPTYNHNYEHYTNPSQTAFDDSYKNPAYDEEYDHVPMAAGAAPYASQTPAATQPYSQHQQNGSYFPSQHDPYSQQTDRSTPAPPPAQEDYGYYDSYYDQAGQAPQYQQQQPQQQHGQHGHGYSGGYS